MSISDELIFSAISWSERKSTYSKCSQASLIFLWHGEVVFKGSCSEVKEKQ